MTAVADAPQPHAWNRLLTAAIAAGWAATLTTTGRLRLARRDSVVFVAGPGAPDKLHAEALEWLGTLERLAEKWRRP